MARDLSETAFQRTNNISLTAFWLWDEIWTLQKMQCHSLSVGHEMRFDEIAQEE
jgi:hypothetical protein